MNEDLTIQKDLISSLKKTISTYEELVEVLKSRIVELEQKLSVQYPQTITPAQPYYYYYPNPYITTTNLSIKNNDKTGNSQQEDVSYQLKNFLEESQ